MIPRGLVWIWLPTLLLTRCIATRSSEASSAFLKLQKNYQNSPHDATLYDKLRVAHNATLADITRSYRRLSREYHPDKRRQQSKKPQEDESSEEDEDADAELLAVRQAYEVLKDDVTRLPYHKYGLLDTRTAALLLTRGTFNDIDPTPEQTLLLKLMGYRSSRGHQPTHRERVLYIAANLVETLRPLVEGAVSQKEMAHTVAQQCDQLKRLPLGSQILRCIGRAYRHAGQKTLRRRKRHNRLTEELRDVLRSAKHLATAAMVSGKLVYKEKRATQQKATLSKNAWSKVGFEDMAQIDPLLQDEDDLFGTESDDQVSESIKQDLKSQTAVIRTLEVEALWKLYKIDLDRTVQEACRLILHGHFFFGGRPTPHGWVSPYTGRVVETHVGRLRAAAAMILVGDIFVQCSKEGTSWKNKDDL